MGDWLYSLLTHEATAVAVGGAAGANARYWLGEWIRTHHWAKHFPWHTMAINVSGSLLLALLMAAFGRVTGPQKFWLLMLGTGLCGGYTTFSTFEVEAYHLIAHGHWGWALFYVLGSVMAGFGAVLLGLYLVHGHLPRQ